MTTAEPTASLRTCGVRVPCSTSNIGAGFDCLGLAFNRYLDAAYVPGGDTLTVQRGGTVAVLDDDAKDSFVAAFRAQLSRHGIDPRGTLTVTSQIPVGRGLGSSGAAVVAGVTLAMAARGDDIDRADALAAALRIEGHPDNAAPSLFGGLVAVMTAEDGTPRALSQTLSTQLGF